MEKPPETPPSAGLSPNIAALLSYLAGWLTGLIFYLIEKENKYVRFHAMQSILFSVALTILPVIIIIISLIVAFIPVIGKIIITVLWIAYAPGAVVLWIFLMVKAYQGIQFKLPFLGDWAEKWS